MFKTLNSARLNCSRQGVNSAFHPACAKHHNSQTEYNYYDPTTSTLLWWRHVVSRLGHANSIFTIDIVTIRLRSKFGGSKGHGRRIMQLNFRCVPSWSTVQGWFRGEKNYIALLDRAHMIERDGFNFNEPWATEVPFICQRAPRIQKINNMPHLPRHPKGASNSTMRSFILSSMHFRGCRTMKPLSHLFWQVHQTAHFYN